MGGGTGTGPIEQGNLSTYVELERRLTQRYEKCNTQGHRKPNAEENYCTHCYRPLELRTPKADALLASNKELPIMDRPMDAPLIQKIKQEEIALQKSLQRFEGIRMLKQELEDSLED